jgi:hypothetical protein
VTYVRLRRGTRVRDLVKTRVSISGEELRDLAVGMVTIIDEKSGFERRELSVNHVNSVIFCY